MSKGARKTGRNRASNIPSRKRIIRPFKTTIMIVGEGRETEKNYFDDLKREEIVSIKFAIKVKKGHGFSPKRVVEEAINYKQQAERRGEEFDEVWCVLDVEGVEKRESLDQAVIMARQNGITLCLSNPCFEVWLLAHFDRIAKTFLNYDAVKRELNRHWGSVCTEEYQKNDERIYERLTSLTKTAIANAKWVRETHFRDEENTADCNSSTEVYKIVGLLFGHPDTT